MYKHTEIRLMSYAALLLNLVIGVASMANMIAPDVLHAIAGGRLVLLAMSLPALVFMVFGERDTKQEINHG